MMDHHRLDPAAVEAVESGKVPPSIGVEFLSETRDMPSIAGILFITILTGLVMVARLASRISIVRKIGTDDIIATISYILFLPFVILSVKLIQLGSGRHFAYIQYVMPVSVALKTEVLDFAAHIIYTTTLLFCRCSGLSFYHRICSDNTRLGLSIKIIFGILIAGYLPQLMLLIFHCRPVTGYWPYGWEPGADRYTCLQWGLVYSVNSSVSLVCDFLLFGLPVAMLKSLNISKRKKIQLASILLPGVIVTGISIARLILVIRGQWEADESWSYDPLLVIETAEIGATIIALSVPGIKPLFDVVVLRRDSMKKSQAQTGASGYGNQRTVGSTNFRSGGTMLSDYETHSGQELDLTEPGRAYAVEGREGSREGSLIASDAEVSSTKGIYVTVAVKEDYKKTSNA